MSYFDFTSPLVPHEKIRANDINPIFAAIAAAFAQLPSAQTIVGGASGFSTSAGTASAYTLALQQPLTSLPAGTRVRMLVHVTSAATPTLNVDGLGAVQIRDHLGVTLPAGALLAGSVETMDFDGSVWRLASVDGVSTIAGFGIGSVGSTVPFVSDFHTASLPAGRYRWEGSTTLNAPQPTGGGTADLGWRGDGTGTWEAMIASGLPGANEPAVYRKATSGTASDWGAWRRDQQYGSNANGKWFRFGGLLQVCATSSLTITRSSSTSMDVTWTFPNTFNGAPWVMIPVLPNTVFGIYSLVSTTDIGSVFVNPSVSAGVTGLVGARSCSGVSFASGANVTNVSAIAVGLYT